MSNHYHVILHVDKARTNQWDAIEVIKRWHRLFKGSKQSQAFSRGVVLEGADRILLDSEITKWQKRLCDISWFMRVVNEKFARRANAEDGCKWRFWEGRYKSQALLDEKALLACMAYVDPPVWRRPLRNSAHTSIKRRIDALRSS